MFLTLFSFKLFLKRVPVLEFFLFYLIVQGFYKKFPEVLWHFTLPSLRHQGRKNMEWELVSSKDSAVQKSKGRCCSEGLDPGENFKVSFEFFMFSHLHSKVEKIPMWCFPVGSSLTSFLHYWYSFFRIWHLCSHQGLCVRLNHKNLFRALRP